MPSLKRLVAASTGLMATLAPATAFAQCDFPNHLCVGLGTTLNFDGIAANFIYFLVISISSLCFAAFVIGALRLVLGGAVPDQVEKGKTLMKGALISFAVVAGAYFIVRIVLYILYYAPTTN